MNTNIISRYYNSHPVIINSIASMFVRSGTVLSRTIFLFIAAKYFNSESFGLLTLAVSLLDIHRVIFDFGTDIYSIRFFSVSEDNIRSKFIDIASIKLLTMSIGYISYIVFSSLLYGRESTPLSLVLGLALFSSSFVNLYINYFQSTLAVNKIATISIIQNIFFFILVLSYSFFSENILIFASIIPICDAAYILLLHPRINKQINISLLDFRINTNAIINIILISFPLGITAIAVTIYTRMDTILINHYFGKEIAANYSLSYRITEPFIMLCTPFFVSSYSHLSQMVSQSKKESIISFCRQFLVATVGFSFTLSVTIFIVAPIFISYMYPEYETSPSLVKIFCIALCFRIISAGLSTIIQSFGKFRWISYIGSFNVISFLAIFFAAVPVMGIYAGAVAIAVTEVINSVIQIMMATKLITTVSQLRS